MARLARSCSLNLSFYLSFITFSMAWKFSSKQLSPTYIYYMWNKSYLLHRLLTHIRSPKQLFWLYHPVHFSKLFINTWSHWNLEGPLFVMKCDTLSCRYIKALWHINDSGKWLELYSSQSKLFFILLFLAIVLRNTPVRAQTKIYW